MAQHTRFQIVRAMEGIDQIAGFVFCDGIDGEVATLEVLLERDIGSGMHGEAGITGPDFALGASERIFFVRLRVEKNREVLADRAKALLDHFLRIAADYDVVVILHRQSQQLIAD
jgi:hypothetical protein